MDATTPPAPHRPAPQGARALPTTVWLPAPDQEDAAPLPGSVLPHWALEKIRTEFTSAGARPEPLLKICLHDTEPGMDTRATCTVHGESGRAGRPPRRLRLLLAELHPDLLPAAGALTPTAPDLPCATDNGWSGFLHRAHRLLPPAGTLLLATRQRRDAGILTDPLGTLIACARTAGFRYLQHIVIAHARPSGDQLLPAPPSDASPGVTHSDLIALTAIHHH